jgi:hypothetical protein
MHSHSPAAEGEHARLAGEEVGREEIVMHDAVAVVMKHRCRLDRALNPKAT